MDPINRYVFLPDFQASEELGELTNLEKLLLQENHLHGSIRALSKLKSLRLLHLVRNKLNGTIPKQLGDMKSLVTLLLNQNQLRGEIPHEVGNLQALEDVMLHSNALTGEIPKEFGKLILGLVVDVVFFCCRQIFSCFFGFTQKVFFVGIFVYLYFGKN